MRSEDAVIGPKTKLSRIQEQLWLAERLGLHATAYSVPLFLGIKGPVDEDALTSSLLDIVTRHEVLRTRIFEEDGELRGEVRPPTDFTVEIRQSSTSDLLNGAGLDAVLAAEAGTPLDVSQGIPLRAKLIRIADDERVLSLVLHHLVFDDWSRNQLYRELAERYRKRATGSRAAPRPLSVQYHQYAVQRDQRNAADREAMLAYWRPVLEHLVPFEIPPDHPRATRRRGRGDAVDFELAAESVDAIRRIGNARDASTAMVLFTAVQVALSRFTGRDDVSFGAPVAARDDDESQELIGPLINTVVVRGDLSGDPPFVELVDRLRDTLLDAMEHSRMPFGDLAAEFGNVADLSRNPLTQVVVQYASGVRRRPGLDGCEVTELAAPTAGSKFDLVILFDELDDGRLTIRTGWDRDLYAVDTIEGFADVLRSVIDDVLLSPQTRLSAIRTFSARAESEVLAHREDPVRDAAGLSPAELVAVQARTRPEAIAVVPEGGRLCTYMELDSMADRVATELSLAGAGPESVVAVHARQSVAQVAAVIGVVRAGAACVAVNPDDPTELSGSVLRESGAEVIMFEGGLPPDLRELAPACLEIAAVLEQDGGLGTRCSSRTHRDAACLIVFGSGATGRLEGVVMTHGGLADRLAMLQDDSPLQPSDSVPVPALTAFDVSVMELFRPLTVGAAALLARPHEIRDGCRGREAPVVVSRERDVVDGGDGPVATAPVGSPPPNTRVYVLDQWWNPVPPGASGELCIGGPGIARGYLGLPALTAQRFVPDPGAIGERLFRTGKIVRYSSATKSYRFLGRRDPQVGTGGVLAAPGDVEGVVASRSAEAEASPAAEVLTEHQRGLLEIWREVLGRADVVATSNFFTSGGNSLVAIQMTNRARERLAVDVPLSLVFEAPVFSDYSARLAEISSCAATGDGIERPA